MPPIQTSLDFKIKVDQASAQQHAAATAQLRQQYDSLVKSGQKLHEEFRVQGQAAVLLHAQIANLNDAYREGKIDQAQYESENARLTAELKKADSAFGNTTQAIRETDTAVKDFYKTIQTEAPKTQTAVDPAKAALTAQRTQISRLGERGRALSAIGTGLSVLGPNVAPLTGPASQVIQAVRGVEMLNMQYPKLAANLLTQGRLTVGATSALQKYIPAMSQSTAQTTVAMGSMVAMAGAAILIDVAFKIAKGIINDSKKATEEFIKVNQRYAELIANGTTPEIEAAIKKNEERNRVLQLEREKLQGLVDAAKNTTGFAGALLDVNDALGINLGGIEDAKNRLKEVDGELDGNINLNNLLTQALKDGTLALNDATAAEEKRRDAVRQALDDASQSTVKNIQDTNDLRTQVQQRALTEDDPKAVQRELDNLHIAYQNSTRSMADLNQAYMNHKITYSDYKDALKAGLLDQQKLIEQMQLWEDILLPAAEANQRLQQAQDGATKSADRLRKASDGMHKDLADAADQMKAYTDEQARVDEDRAVKAQQDQEDFERKRVQDLADHYADMADLDAKYYDDRANLLDNIAADLQDIDQKRLDAIKDYNKESRRLAEDHKDTILQIQRDTDRDYMDAARARDTAGALAALRSGEQKLDDEQRSYEKEQKRRAEDEKDLLDQLADERKDKLAAGQQALRDLDAQHRKERAAKEAAFRQQLQREDEQRRIEAQRQADAYRKEDQDRQTHYGVVETDTTTHYGNVEAIAKTGMDQVEQTILAKWNSINGAMGSTPVGSPAVSGGTTLPTAYAAGGTPPLFRRVSVGEIRPETAVFASGRRQIVGLHGRESAMFTEPVHIYPSAGAGAGINVNLGGIRIQAGGNAKAIAQKLSQSDFNRYLTRAIDDYVGGVR